nr:hypothetical protein CFP56_64764 [Quercus suber]
MLILPRRDDDLRKDEILEALEQHLDANARVLSRDSRFEGFYRTARSPVKSSARSNATAAAAAPAPADDSGEVRSVVRGRGRRATQVKEEELPENELQLFSSPTATISTATRQLATSTRALTSSAARRLPRASLPSPASPSAVAEHVEQQASRATSHLTTLWHSSGLPMRVARLREKTSSVQGVTATALLIEIYGLSSTLLPRRLLFDVPWLPILGMPARLPVTYNDLSALLAPLFWRAVLLWSCTSVLLPALLGYFYNLTATTTPRRPRQQQQVDPLMFHVAKALVAYFVYAQRARVVTGLVDPIVVETVAAAMPGGGGVQTMLLGSFVGMLAALYEAAQRR